MTEPSPYRNGKRLMRYALIVILLLVPIVPTTLSYHGFCFGQMRFMSDAEMIEPAVQAIAKRERMVIDQSPTSVGDFLQRNPDCCAVDRYPDRRWWLDVLTGLNISEVEVNFELDPKRYYSIENYYRYYKQYVSVSACGKVLKMGPGTSTPTLENTSRLTGR